jgi:hypothetical protein
MFSSRSEASSDSDWQKWCWKELRHDVNVCQFLQQIASLDSDWWKWCWIEELGDERVAVVK